MAGRGQIEGSQIINYQGNADLALGGGAGLDVYGNTDTSEYNKIVHDLALQAHADNVMLWRKRMDDRDKVRQTIDDDEIAVPDILEQNRPYVEGKIKDARQFFYDNVDHIMDDPAKYREYKAKLADAKSAAKQANTNFLLFSAEQKELGKTTNSIDADKRKQFLSQQLEKIKNNPNALIDPYVPISDITPAATAKPVYGPETQRREGDYMVSESKVDPQATLDQYRKNFFLKENYDGFLRYADLVKQNPKMVDEVNAKIADLNTKLGLQGDKVIKPIDFTQDKTPDIAAKIALADNPPLVQKKEYAKEQVQDQIERTRLAEASRHNRGEEALGWARIAQDKNELQAKKDQWAATQKGGDTTKNGAFEFANRLYGDLTKLADKNGVITPDQIRQMNSEQLKYLGLEQDGSLSQLQLKPNEALQLVNGQVRVLTDAKPVEGDANGRWTGNWDQNRSTTVYNIATNRLNEENMKAGSKELNSYMPIDTGAGGISETTTGASSSVRGGTSSKQGQKSKTPKGLGTPIVLNGQTYYTKDGVNFVDSNGKSVQ